MEHVFSKPLIGASFRKSKSKKEPKEKNRVQKNFSQSPLAGSKFRILNEVLYKSTSEHAWKQFHNNEENFKIYHNGYRSQTNKWPSKPVDVIISYIKSKQQKFYKKVLIDLGCGDAQIYDCFSDYKLLKKIYSFDLCSVKPHVIACDIKKLPLEDDSADIAVFCLSLMGKNYIEFIIESIRCVKIGGYLFIAEVESRMPSKYLFIKMVEALGLKLTKIIENSTHFIILLFRVVERKKLQDFKMPAKVINENIEDKKLKEEILSKNSSLSEISTSLLKPCLYKKRQAFI